MRKWVLSFAPTKSRREYQILEIIKRWTRISEEATITVLDVSHWFLHIGTWQTYVVKDQSVWHKINKEVPMEYAATVTVNPLTALRMLEDFVSLKAGLVIVEILMFFFLYISSFIINYRILIGDSVVQNGATSIVGQCIIQLAKIRSIHSINIIRDRCWGSTIFLLLFKLVGIYICFYVYLYFKFEVTMVQFYS